MIDRYYKQNVIGISGAELLWGFGLPIVLESTFLQLFLKSLGATSFQVGLIPAFLFLGNSVFALISSYYTEGLEYKRPSVIYLHLVSGSSLVFFGAVLFSLGEQAPVLTIFFGAYAVFSICIGMTIPVWLNYVVNIFTEKKSYSGMGFMLLTQNVAKLSSSLLIVKIVETYAFSQTSSAVVFLGVGILFCGGGFFFLLTKEIPGTPDISRRDNRSFRRYVHNTSMHIIKNRNFLWFLAGDMDFYVIVTVISFYANYATAFCGIESSIAAGFFVSFLYMGAIMTNIVLGSLDMFAPRNKYIISKSASLVALLLLIIFGSQWSFFLASGLLGIARGSRMVVYPPVIKKLSGREDVTGYFAVAPILTIPFALALPMAYGSFLDYFTHLNGDAYRIVFILSLGLILGCMFCILQVDFQKNQANTAGS